ncbi:MAG: accessory gene regulator B family protein, partial [Clostridiales bacterium]|nr:accessory gene regulator B family protein [Clostridiales bacterium]
VASVVMSLSTILISDYMFPVICKLGVTLSAIIIFLIGTIRDPNLRLTDAEYEHLRKRSRIGIIFVGAIVMLFCSFSPKDNYVPYMALGIIYNAFSLLIVKLLRKEVRTDDEA